MCITKLYFYFSGGEQRTDLERDSFIHLSSSRFTSLYSVVVSGLNKVNHRLAFLFSLINDFNFILCI